MIIEQVLKQLDELFAQHKVDQVEAFLNIIWDPPFFYDCKSKEQVEWHYTRWSILPNAEIGIRTSCTHGLINEI